MLNGPPLDDAKTSDYLSPGLLMTDGAHNCSDNNLTLIPTYSNYHDLPALLFTCQQPWRRNKNQVISAFSKKGQPSGLSFFCYSSGLNLAIRLTMPFISSHHWSFGRSKRASIMRSKSRMSWKLNFPFCRPIKAQLLLP